MWVAGLGCVLVRIKSFWQPYDESGDKAKMICEELFDANYELVLRTGEDEIYKWRLQRKWRTCLLTISFLNKKLPNGLCTNVRWSLHKNYLNYNFNIILWHAHSAELHAPVELIKPFLNRWVAKLWSTSSDFNEKPTSIFKYIKCSAVPNASNYWCHKLWSW